MKQLLLCAATMLLMVCAREEKMYAQSAKSCPPKAVSAKKTVAPAAKTSVYTVCEPGKGAIKCGQQTMVERRTISTPALKAPRYVVHRRSGVPMEGYGKVCKPKGGSTECYSTANNENYHVCREERGYYICGMTPNRYNSTFGNRTYYSQPEEPQTQPYFFDDEATPENKPSNNQMRAPENQSYKNINITSSTGYSNTNLGSASR